MDQWLVRTTENQILGPYSRDQVCKLITEGELTLDDEVCGANHYWFYLHERDEVAGQLGIEVPQSMYELATEEPTESLTVEITEESTDPDLSSRLSGSEGDPTSTTVLSSEALRRQFQRRSSTPGGGTVRKVADQAQFHTPWVVSHLEKPSVWAWLAWLLIGVAGFLVFYVLRLLSVRGGG